jgi:hypothetical protein
MAEITHRTRFAGLARWQAILIAIATIGLIISGLNLNSATKSHHETRAPTQAAGDPNPDLTLYRTIVARVAKGDGFYGAAAEEQRKGHYPLRPFVVVRLPTLAVVSATLGMPAMHGLNWLLIASVLLAWWLRLATSFADPVARAVPVLLIETGLTAASMTSLVYLHEIWAGLLIALAFALHRPDRWLPSVLLALAAVMIREIALPFLLLMGAIAFWNRAWKEAWGWVAATALFAGLLFLHAGQVAQVTTAQDLASPGWDHFGGWPFYTMVMHDTTALRAFPALVSALLCPLALLGWASWNDAAGRTGFLMFAGYALALMLFGRPDNFYWGFVVAPVFLLGLAFLPSALPDLWHRVSARHAG